ncbi:hypothetical protein PR048_006030 [Dryococelus australis]|uniref:Uncharacterized protein n=1 Tax=Dryococelus australis TaxID=614101 RepID=A0ABQ9I9T8_9NEOP|nr:hypothetical protein PR048_006030 [Dryococelus australis]
MGHVPHWVAALLLCACVVSCVLADETTVKPTESGPELEADSQQQVSILKRINKVNSDGSYTYGYEAVDGSFKIETRDVEGNVKGVFGYLDETGKIKRVSYSTKNGTEYQSGVLITPENETASTSSTPLAYQQILRPQVTQVASASTTTESQVSARRPVFRPSNPRSTTEPSTTLTTKSSDQAIRKVYPVYNPYQHTSTKNKSSEDQANSKVNSNRTMLRKEHTNTSTSESSAHSTSSRRPVHAVYGQYIRQPSTHLHRMQNRSTTNDFKNDSSDPHYNSQTQLYEDLIQALDTTDDTALMFSLPSRSFGSRRSPEDDDTSDETSLETDGSRSALDHIYYRQTRRNSSGNGLRRQLSDESGDLSSSLAFSPSKSQLTATDDSGDVYGGSTPTSTPRPLPSFALRPYGIGPSRPRIVDDAILQNHYIGTQGAVTNPTVPYVPEDTTAKVPNGRFPYGNIRPGDFRRVYVTPQGEYDGTYNLQPYDMRDMLTYITQLLIYQLQQNYNTRLTPPQIALIQMLGIDIPPGLVQNSYYPQAAFVPRRQDYPQEQNPYSPNDDTLYVTSEDPRLYARRRPYYRARPQLVPFPYDGRQPERYDPRVAYTPSQAFLPRYYPQQPLPFNSPEVQYRQGGRVSGRSPQVAMPQEVFPDEYRDAIFLRMLLTARAQQAPAKGQTTTEQSRPVLAQADNQRTVLVRPRPVYSVQESVTTTGRPRTLAPARNVQILDPVTEEPTVKRSTDNTTAPAALPS